MNRTKTIYQWNKFLKNPNKGMKMKTVILSPSCQLLLGTALHLFVKDLLRQRNEKVCKIF